MRRQLQILVHEYMQEHNVESADLKLVAKWAIKRGKWDRPPMSREKQCQREISRALRAETYTDPQGREVRRMHPVRYGTSKGPLTVLWYEHTTARPKQMQTSLAQRRNGIRYDVRQHFLDWESYNENNVHGAQLPLFDYDFNKDAVEMQQPPSYPYEKPDDDDKDNGN